MTNRQKFMLSVSAIALTAMMGIGAAAAGTVTLDYDDSIAITPPTGPGSYTTALVSAFATDLNNEQYVTAAIAGSVLNTSASIVFSGTGAPQIVSNDTISALAIGNTAYNLTLGIGDAGDNEGSGSLSAQLVANTTVTADVNSGDVFIDLTDFESGAIVLSYNDILATASVNKEVTEITGSVSSDLSSTVAGTVDIDFGTVAPNTGSIDTAGTSSIVVSQINWDSGPVSGSHAGITDSDVYLVVDADTALPQTLVSDPVISNNNIIAGYTGNDSATRFLATAGENTEYAGTANIASFQLNYDDGTGGGFGTDAGAFVVDSQITALIESSGALNTDLTTFTGDLTLSDNTIAASIVGNDAFGPVPTYFDDPDYAPNTDVDGSTWGGNQLIIDGLNVVGTGLSGDNDLEGSAGNVNGELEADLAVLSVQGNVDTQLSALVDNAAVSAGVEIIDGGSVTLSGNAIGSSAMGNAASNLIDASGPVIDATVATGNLQLNANTNILAENFESYVGVSVNLSGDITGGNLTITDTSLTAATTASLYSGSVVLSAEDLSTTGGRPLADADFDRSYPEADLWTDGGITMSNLQMNVADTGDAIIYAGVVDATIELLDSVPFVFGFFAANTDVTDSLLTISDNTVTAGAAGNVAEQSLDLSGVNAGLGTDTLSAVIGNSQTNWEGDFDVSVEGEVENLTVSILFDDVDPSALTISGTDVDASAVGNATSNSMTVSGFANLEIGDVIPVLSSGDYPTYYDLGGPDHEAEAAFLIASDQLNDAETNADVAGFLVQIWVDSLTDSSTATIADNSFSSDATANEAVNSLDMNSIVNLTTASDLADIVAAVSNAQAFFSDVYTETSGTVHVTTNDLLEDSTVTLSNNDRSALTVGNLSDNSLSFSATNHDYNAEDATEGVVNNLSLGSDIWIDAAFAVQNVQYGFGEVYSTASGDTYVEVGINFPFSDEIINSVVTLTGNDTTAETRVNITDNDLSLDGVDLGTSAGVNNLQLYGDLIDDVSADASGDVFVDMDDDALGAVLTLSNNDLSAVSLVNDGANSLDVTAVDLTGGASLTDVGVSAPGTLTGADAFINSTDFAVGSFQGTYAEDVEADANRNVYVLFGNTTFDNVVGAIATITENDVSSWAQANLVANSVDIDVVNSLDGLTDANGEGISAGIANLQETEVVSIDAETGVNFNIEANGGVDSGPIVGLIGTVSANTGSATARSNYASNVITADSAAGLIGRETDGVGTIDYDVTGTLTAEADFALLNRQSTLADEGIGAFVTFDNIGYQQNTIDEDNDNLDGIHTIVDNSLTAMADSNLAVNVIALDATVYLSTSASLVNEQITSAVIAAGVGAFDDESYIGVTTSGDVIGGAYTVAGNSLTASAHANTAVNAVSASSAAVIDGNGDPAGSLYDYGDDFAQATADYSALSFQLSEGGVAAQVEFGEIIGIGVDNIVDAAAGVLDNALTAVAGANYAENSVALDGAFLAATGAVANLQGNLSPVFARVTFANAAGYIGIVTDGALEGDVTGTPLTVSGNSLEALASGNTAINNVTATSSVGFDLAGGLASAEIDSVAELISVDANYSVLNTQYNEGAVSGQVDMPDLIGVSVDALTNSPVAVLNTIATASADGNVADNRVSIDSTSIAATGAIVSAQDNVGAITASILYPYDGFWHIGIETDNDDGIADDDAIDPALAVAGHALNAVASGNTASNVLLVTATTGYEVNPGTATAGTTATGYASEADFAVLNLQSNEAPVTASISNGFIGVNNWNGGENLVGGEVDVLNNEVLASATGNQALNVVLAGDTVGSSPSMALTNVQLNTGPISATVSNVQIGVVAGPTSSSANTVSGNTIGASAVGNAARNIVGTLP